MQLWLGTSAPPTPVALTSTVALGLATSPDGCPDGHPRVMPAESPDGGIAALLIQPDTCPTWVNGVRAPLGLVVLNHADEVSVGGTSYWVSDGGGVVVTTFNPGGISEAENSADDDGVVDDDVVDEGTVEDGTVEDPASETEAEPVYCFITKSRLKPGEEIVACPGPAGVECGILYRRAAWEMAVESDPRFRCPNCGFDPSAGQWQPPAESSVEPTRILELARARARNGVSAPTSTDGSQP